MLKSLNLDEFYTEENKKIDRGAGIGAVGLLTPHQFIKVLNYEVDGIDGLGSHDGTYMYLLNEMYGLNAPINKKGFPDMSVVTNSIPNGKMNYVYIDFVVQRTLDFATVNIPKFITTYQYEELEKLSEELKKYDITIETIINHYDPLKTSYSESYDDKYYPEENSIDLALQYMKENNRVVDYDLPFEEEKIIEQKKNHI